MSRATRRAHHRIEGGDDPRRIEGSNDLVPERSMPVGPPNPGYEVTGPGGLAVFNDGVEGYPGWGDGDEGAFVDPPRLASFEPWQNGPHSDRSYEVNTGGLEGIDVPLQSAGFVPVIPEFSPSVAGRAEFRPDYGIAGKLDMPFFPGDDRTANEPEPSGNLGELRDVTRSGHMGPQPIFPDHYTDWERPDPTEQWAPFGGSRMKRPIIID